MGKGSLIGYDGLGLLCPVKSLSSPIRKPDWGDWKEDFPSSARRQPLEGLTRVLMLFQLFPNQFFDYGLSDSRASLTAAQINGRRMGGLALKVGEGGHTPWAGGSIYIDGDCVFDEGPSKRHLVLQLLASEHCSGDYNFKCWGRQTEKGWFSCWPVRLSEEGEHLEAPSPPGPLFTDVGQWAVRRYTPHKYFAEEYSGISRDKATEAGF